MSASSITSIIIALCVAIIAVCLMLALKFGKSHARRYGALEDQSPDAFEKAGPSVGRIIGQVVLASLSFLFGAWVYLNIVTAGSP